MNQIQEYRVPVAIGVVTLIVAIVLYVALISPQSAQLNTVNANKVTLQAQLSGLQSELTTLQTEKQKLPADCSQLVKISTQIPSVQSPADLSAEESSFFSQLTDLVTTSGVQIPTFAFSGAAPAASAPSSAGSTSAAGAAPAASSAAVVPVPVSMTIIGNYGQMSTFVAGLDSFPRLFVIQTFGLALGGTVAGSAPTVSALGGSPPLWIGGKTNPPSAGPYTLTISGSIYYTSQPSATLACQQAGVS